MGSVDNLESILGHYNMHDAYNQKDKFVTVLKTKLNTRKNAFIKVEESLRSISNECNEAVLSKNELKDSPLDKDKDTNKIFEKFA